MQTGDVAPSTIYDVFDDSDADGEGFVGANNNDEPGQALDTTVESINNNGSESVAAGAVNNANDSVDGDDIESRHLQLPTAMTGCNSPRKRAEVAKCWTIVKRLRSSKDAPDFASKWVDKGFTHVCVHGIPADEWGGEFCNTPLKLHRLPTKDKKSLTWVTTHATNHISRYHKEHAVADEVEKRANVAHNDRVSQMTGLKHEKEKVVVKVGAKGNTIEKFVLSKRQWQLTRQARWYIYSDQKVSKRQFTNEYFKDMLGAMSDKPSDAAILTRDQLVKYVRAEFSAFLHFLKLMLNEKVLQAKGNQFAQVLHDGGTLKNKKKYQGMAIQFMDPRWRGNHVICTGFSRSTDGTDAGVAALLKENFKERTSFDLNAIASRSMQDGAAKGNSNCCRRSSLVFNLLFLLC